MDTRDLIEMLEICSGKNDERDCRECRYSAEGKADGRSCMSNLMRQAANTLRRETGYMRV